MIPGADAFNHDEDSVVGNKPTHPSKNSLFQYEKDKIIMMAQKAFKKGEEVTITYDVENLYDLFKNYGYGE